MLEPYKILKEDGPRKHWSILMKCESCRSIAKLKYKSYLTIRKKDHYYCLSCAMRAQKEEISESVKKRWENPKYRNKVTSSLKEFRSSDKWVDVKQEISSKLVEHYKDEARREIARIKAKESFDADAQSLRSTKMWKSQVTRDKIVKSLKESTEELRIKSEIRALFRND